jgi:hypothetical protein
MDNKMNRPARERWTFTVELPPGIANPGRYVAAVLKHIWRRWGVRATAVLDVQEDGTEAAETSPSTTERDGDTHAADLHERRCHALSGLLSDHSHKQAMYRERTRPRPGDDGFFMEDR